MSKRCARCEKVVYPIEELKCLDKLWHKGCFKCQECNMTLSMKTYKGFDKLPYCESHIPKAKATTVAETPEMKRLTENTKIQSNVKYHAEFEKNKARFTQVADDPETLRLKQNTRNISNATYHGDLEKKTKMEQQRNNNQSASPSKSPVERVAEPLPVPVHQSVPSQMPQRHATPSQYTSGAGATKQQQQQQPQHTRMQQAPQGNHYYQSHPHAPTYHSQSQYPQQVMPPHQQQPMHHPPPQQYHQHHQSYNNPITPAYSYQDANRNAPAQYGARTSQHLIYSSQTGPVTEAAEKVGSIADYDPMNNQFGAIPAQVRHQSAPAYRQDPNKGQRGHYHREGPQMAVHNQHMAHPHQKINAPPTNLGRCYRAVCDYEAADADEISFKDGDLIVNCTGIDEGWMTGTVQRSGRVGVLPANYVQRVS